MTGQENKAGGNSIVGKPRSKQDSAQEADSHHATVKHDEPLGRIGIAPAKPVWPSKK